MVGSNLNSTQTAHLVSLCDGGSDLDGSLLVDAASQIFSGGFTYDPNGCVELDRTQPGLGIELQVEG